MVNWLGTQSNIRGLMYSTTLDEQSHYVDAARVAYVLKFLAEELGCAELGGKGKDGSTPVHIAALRGNLDMLKFQYRGVSWGGVLHATDAACAAVFLAECRHTRRHVRFRHLAGQVRPTERGKAPTQGGGGTKERTDGRSDGWAA